MAIMLVVGESWIRRSGRSPEWWDSWVIMLWVSGPDMSSLSRLTDMLQGIGKYSSSLDAGLS
jgi:hypothetical protein